jgi:hypothetical protein
MHFDHLDKTYAMVKSNWHFEHFGLTGLAGVCQVQTGVGAESTIWPITESYQLVFLYKPYQPLLTMII